jgi:hypothetical protein
LQYLPEPDLASYRYCADLYLCYVANLLGGSILIPEAYTAYRLHDSNQFQTNPIIGDNSGIGDMKKHPVHADMQDSVRKGFIDSYHKLSTLYGISGYLKLVARTTPFKKLFPTCKILHDARILSSRQICFFAFRCMYYNIKYWYLLLFKPVKLPQMLDL